MQITRHMQGVNVRP